MGEPFLGEIRMVGFNFAHRGFTSCEGQLIAINTNQALFSLLGTTYGGDGRTTFALPDLRGRYPLGTNNQIRQGSRSGAETVTLNANHLPGHTHALPASDADGDVAAPGAAVPAVTADPAYAPAGPPTDMVATAGTGAGQPHNNMSPYLGIRFVIATAGIFPPRN